MISLLGGRTASQHECSRSGCQHEAGWAILWRNPKIHSADRRKTWLACDEHCAYLQDFLEARSFPLEVMPLSDLPARTSAEEHLS